MLHPINTNGLCFVISYCIAKAAQRQKEAQSSGVAASLNANNKRPLASGSNAASSSQALKRDSRLGTYFEYDLSKMKNSKGGFLLDDESKTDENQRRKEKERERQRQMHNVEDLRASLNDSLLSSLFLLRTDSAIFLDPERNPKCQECNTVDINPVFLKVFKCRVCKTCENKKPERYSLLTKTECKEVKHRTLSLTQTSNLMSHFPGLPPNGPYVPICLCQCPEH